MAGAPEKVRPEDIDLVLRDAEVCFVELNYLHIELNKVNSGEDELSRSAEIESKCATIFRDMMSNLYSVLDQIYYFLYCHCQNNGNVSFSNAAFKIKQPMKQDLKWSKDNTRDECKRKCNSWVTDRCKEIFGSHSFEESKRNYVRHFQNNLLRLQAIREVDKSGKEVFGTNDEPKLLYVVNIQHGAGGDLSKFSPSKVTVDDLKSVAVRPWNDTINFNLLHFFRNFTAHRSLVACKTKKGYLNFETREFKPADDADQHLTEPWILIAAGAWILVPELSHLRQMGRVSSPTFHQFQLTIVCGSLLDFVKTQRYNLVQVLNDIEKYRYEVNRFDNGIVTFKEKGKDLGKCRWEVAHLWPGVKK